jgi:hypothetical protein
VISRDLAQRLAPHLAWKPANGDMFFIPRPEIADSVFTVSDMVVELIVAGGESRFHFNGTVEWALDSVESDGVVWLLGDQLRRARRVLYPWILDWFRRYGQRPRQAYRTEAELTRQRLRPGGALCAWRGAAEHDA